MSNYIMCWKEENQEEYNKLLKLAKQSKRCQACHAVLTKVKTPYCGSCYIKHIRYGNSDRRVKFSAVGDSAINYQQHLYKKFFTCNAPIKYRGTKEKRVYNSLEPSLIKESVQNLIIFLHSDSCPYDKQFKTLNKETQFKSSKRILYNLVLHYIAHYYCNSPFISYSHFKANTVWNFLIAIERELIRYTQVGSFNTKDRLDLRERDIKLISSSINNIASPIVLSL